MEGRRLADPRRRQVEYDPGEMKLGRESSRTGDDDPMSLVVAFSGHDGAVIAGDLREILMQGPDAETAGFEQELYSGQIVNDTDLWKRAAERGIALQVRDDKCKVSDQGGILVGEVSESDGATVRIRRLFVSCGTYAIVDVTEGKQVLQKTGKGSSFVVLGNEVTKRIAHDMIQEEWKNGTFADAVRIIIGVMTSAASCTASVSRAYTILQTRRRADLDIATIMNYEKGGRDQEGGW